MNIEPGFEFAIPYEVVRKVVDKEEVEVDGKKTIINNNFENLYLVKPIKSNIKPILVCFDGFTPDRLKRLAEIGQEMAGWMK